jgi:PAS domain S-box-containing protein
LPMEYVSLTSDLDPELECESPILRDILQLWRDVCKGKQMPLRADVDLQNIAPSLQPHILVLDIERLPKVRLRWTFIGSHITTIQNRDMTGSYCDEIYNADQLTSLQLRTNWVLEHQLPLRSTGHATDPGRNYDENEALFLPMSSDGSEIDAILMGSVFRFRSGSELTDTDSKLESLVHIRTRELFAAKENAENSRKIIEEASQAKSDALANLKANEDRFKDFAESSSDWFWEMDKDLCFSYISEKFTDITGVAPEFIVGKTSEELGMQYDRDSQRNRVADFEALRAFKNFEHSLNLLDGKIVYLSSSGKPVLDDDGRFSGFRGTGSDVTEKKVTELNLKQALADAENSNRAKSRFLTNMSHELRTPLNAIIGFSQLLEQGYCGPVNEKQKQAATDIRGSGEHLHDLITDILDYSKIEAGKYTPNFTLIDVASQIDNSIKLVAGRAHEAGLPISVKVPHSCPDLYADERIFKQMLINLLSNSIKFTPAGGEIVVSVSLMGGNEVMIEVRDSGIGMKSTDIPVALEAFGQIDNTLAREAEGTGLGLPLVQSFMELHNGRFEIESEFGKGRGCSEFRVTGIV